MSSPDPVSAPGVVSAPAGAAPPRRTSLSRRDLLRRSAALATTGATVAVLRPAIAQAQTPDALPAMRSPQRRLYALDGAAAEAPTPELVALNRIAFGPRPGDLDALLALGDTSAARLQAYVDQQLNPAAIDDSVRDAVIAAQGFATLGKSRAQLWQDHVVKTAVTWDERMQPARETMAATFLRAVYSRRQLVEVLADFWHNHFNVYAWDFWPAPVWVHYDRDVLRANLDVYKRQAVNSTA